MTAKNWRILVLLPWLALPLLLGCYVTLWRKLPAELAVQFDSSGVVTNSISRTQALLIESAILIFVLARYTLKLWDERESGSKTVIAVYYAGIIFITSIFLALLKFNL